MLHFIFVLFFPRHVKKYLHLIEKPLLTPDIWTGDDKSISIADLELADLLLSVVVVQSQFVFNKCLMAIFLQCICTAHNFNCIFTVLNAHDSRFDSIMWIMVHWTLPQNMCNAYNNRTVISSKKCRGSHVSCTFWIRACILNGLPFPRIVLLTQ